MLGRKTRCPQCGTRLLVRTKRGRTRLVLAGVSGADSTTTIPIPVLETLEFEMVPDMVIEFDRDLSEVTTEECGGRSSLVPVLVLLLLLALMGICNVAAIVGVLRHRGH
jgi:hypothetical protein